MSSSRLTFAIHIAAAHAGRAAEIQSELGE